LVKFGPIIDDIVNFGSITFGIKDTKIKCIRCTKKWKHTCTW